VVAEDGADPALVGRGRAPDLVVLELGGRFDESVAAAIHGQICLLHINYGCLLLSLHKVFLINTQMYLFRDVFLHDLGLIFVGFVRYVNMTTNGFLVSLNLTDCQMKTCQQFFITFCPIRKGPKRFRP
jgi:hypothetical protein